MSTPEYTNGERRKFRVTGSGWIDEEIPAGTVIEVVWNKRFSWWEVAPDQGEAAKKAEGYSVYDFANEVGAIHDKTYWGGYLIHEDKNYEFKNAEDDAVSPMHYQFPGGIQVIDITKHLGFLEGNIIKYVARAGRKTDDKLTDLLKAQKYLEILIDKEQNA